MVGSPVDVATLVVVLVELGYRVRPRITTVAAAVVALAEGRDDVDDDRLASELDVEDREIESVKTTFRSPESTDE